MGQKARKEGVFVSESLVLYLFLRTFFGIRIQFMERLLGKVRDGWATQKVAKTAVLIGLILVLQNYGPEREEGK